VSVAVVLQASGPNSLGIVRGLGRAGVPVVACDHDPRALGLLSRHARPHLTADPVDEPDRFVADLEDLAGTLPEGGVLFATHDEALAAMGPHEARLGAAGLRRPWSPWATLRPVLDKAAQHAAPPRRRPPRRCPPWCGRWPPR
jgi:predicted ATP-grasp superfamily ATP-dependent carboligase